MRHTDRCCFCNPLLQVPLNGGAAAPSTTTQWYDEEDYDVVIVGAGHAGCEAALASARMGAKTLLLTLNLDRIAWQASMLPALGYLASSTVEFVDCFAGAGVAAGTCCCPSQSGWSAVSRVLQMEEGFNACFKPQPAAS